MGHPTCRASTRSPVDFRHGRRASDGLVAQGILNQVDNSICSVAFNSQRLHEACKTKGVLELHLLQQEAASLSSQYQSFVPQEEINVRQREHSQFHVSPMRTANDPNTILFQCGYKYEDLSFFNKNVSGITSDISNYVGMMKNDLIKQENVELFGSKYIAMNSKNDLQSLQQGSLQKPPLQQQLMQHRLLQQKRQILQKQGAMETCLSRRQILRQQSYKMAQSTPFPLPPLPFPLSEKESEDLLAFQKIVENPNFSPCSSPLMNSPNHLKSTHLHNSQRSQAVSPQTLSNENGAWTTLSNKLQSSCQISDASTTHELFHQQLTYHQVYYILQLILITKLLKFIL